MAIENTEHMALNQKKLRKAMPDILFAGIVLALAYFLFHPFANFSEDSKQGIQFQRGDWEAAQAAAKEQDKVIFLNLYATWCAPCRKLKVKTFSDEGVGDFFNEAFINVSLDGEGVPGQQLMEKYRMRGFPSLLFIDGNGRVLSRKAGYLSPEELLRLGESIPAAGTQFPESAP